MTKLKDLRQPLNFYGKTWIINTICKEDLKEYLKEKEIKEIDDAEMGNIANKISDFLMYDYWNCLKETLLYYGYKLR